MDKRIGIIGVGKIGSAITRGFCGLRHFPTVVSPRSAAKVALLKEELGDALTVAENNQDVVDNSDIILIGLLASIAQVELPQLKFREGQLIISMMATVKYEQLISWMPDVEPLSIVRTVPLPSNARGIGPILMYPASTAHKACMSTIGTVVEVKDENEMSSLVAVTGMIAPFHAMQQALVDVALQHGVGIREAESFVAAFHHALADGATRAVEERHKSDRGTTETDESEHASRGTFELLAEEASTPGGLNEQSLRTLNGTAHFNLLRESMTAIVDRLAGR